MHKALTACLMAVLLLGGCSRDAPVNNTVRLEAVTLAKRQAQSRNFHASDYAAVLRASAALLQDMGFTIDEADYGLGLLTGSKGIDVAAVKAGLSGKDVTAALGDAWTDGLKANITGMAITYPLLSLGGLGSFEVLLYRYVDFYSLGALPAQFVPEVPRFMNDSLENSLENYRERVNAADALALVRVSLVVRPADAGPQQGQAAGRQKSPAMIVRATFQHTVYNGAGQVTRQERIDAPLLYQFFFDKLAQAVFLEEHEL